MNAHQIEKYVVFALLIAAGTAFVVYEIGRSNKLVAQATAANAVLQKSNSALRQQMQARDQMWQSKIDALLKQAAKVKTPAEVVKYIPQFLPSLPQPIKVTPSQTPVPGKLTPPPTQAVIPAADFLPIYQHEVACKKCTYALAQEQQDIASVKQQNVNLQQENGNLKRALKGGSWLHRLWHDTKLLLIGGGVGAALLCGTGHCH